MTPLRFGEFVLDAPERRLTRDGAVVELGGRYFDALALLVREGGTLVTKERLLGEVWRGVPVTDEALTQAIRTIRRALGDEAARPRFIATVPKHGYRFIAPVTAVEDDPAPSLAGGAVGSGIAAGALGGAASGTIGGLLYGFAAAAQAGGDGPGAASVLLVLVAVCAVVGLLAGTGVGGGIAVAAAARRAGAWRIAGGALGGLLVGAAVQLLGSDAFALLLGQTPGVIAGAGEGALLGAATGLASWLGAGRLRSGVLAALALGGPAGGAIALLGGRLMAGSLVSLAGRFPASRLHHALPVDLSGALLVTAVLEAALFAGCVVAALTLAQRRGGRGDRR